MDDQERHRAVMRTVIAALRLAGDDPQAAAVARSRPSSPAPSRQAIPSSWREDSCWRRSPAACPATPEPPGAPIERALDLAEPGRMLFPSLIRPAPGLLERHARQRTAHAGLSACIL